VILTLTPNPTIDRAVYVRDFRFGAVVRAEREVVTPSGKGVDASLVIHELGGETVVLGLSAGINGRLHGELLDVWGIPHDMVPAGGETRMSTVLIDLGLGEQSTISAPTLQATPEHLALLLQAVDRHADRAWGLICGGSLPAGLEVDSYAHLVRRARERGLVVLLDTSGEALRAGVAACPDILKVNRQEMLVLDGGLPDPGAGLAQLAARLASRLGEWAARAIVVTLGRDGALAVTQEGVFHARSLPVPAANTAGAGDALDGALMLYQSRGQDWPRGLAAGTAAAASVVAEEGTAICHREQVEAWLPLVEVTRIELAAASM
jgi:1-phosphofructokinase